MRSKFRSIAVALVAVCALGAVASASASAAEWFVGGSPLTGSAPLSSTTVPTERIELYTTEAAPIVVCEGLELETASITAKVGGQIGHLLFTECEARHSSTCTLVGTTVESKPLTIEAVLGGTSPEDKLVLKPVTKLAFLEYKFKGSSCPYTSEIAVTGKVKMPLPKGRDELAEQELVLAQSGSSELNWEAAEFHFGGKVKLKLSSGKAWSFH
jgi:hypothetical protein